MIYKYTYPPSILPEDQQSGRGWWTPSDEFDPGKDQRLERGGGYEGNGAGGGGYHGEHEDVFDWGWAD